METQEQKKRRLYGKVYLPHYLQMLQKLTHIHIEKLELLTIVDTDIVLEKSRAMTLSSSVRILFEDKGLLKEIIQSNIPSQLESFFLLTSVSKDCGALRLKSLTDFNFNFSFDADENGVISLIDSTITTEIMLDFFREDCIEYLEIEIRKITPDIKQATLPTND